MVSSSPLLLLLITCCCLLATNCSGLAWITPENPVKDNETIISIGESFALGFFSPDNSSDRYVGIWYNKIPGPTVVWVANRDNPVPDPSGSFAIAQDGNLVVLDRRNNTLWSTNVTGSIASDANVSAVLIESGNLVLRHRNQTVLWESFNYPTDTFLPGMKLRLNLTTHESWNIRSWKDANDPSTGSYSLGIETQGPFAELVMFKGNSERVWRSGVLTNGDLLSGLTQNPNFLTYITVSSRDQEVYVTIAVSEASVETRFVLTPTGRIQQLSWQPSDNRWDSEWASLSKQCFGYNYCGPFGICDVESGTDCDCVQGYVPKNQEEWDRGNHSAGCEMRKELSCRGGDYGFVKVGRTTLPDLPTVAVGNSSETECEAQCRSNCSCVAYAFANVTWATATCLIWTGHLIDIEGNLQQGHAFHLRLHSSELETESSKSRRNLLVIILPTCGGFLCLVVIFAYYLWWRKHKQGTEGQGHALKVANTSISKNLISSEVPLFQFQSIVAATNNFDEANKLGQGGFGPVYKGKLEDQDIAVKRLSENSSQGLIELKNEVELIAKLQHKNLVRLLGWCIHEEEKMLIYEYLPNRSLDQFLFDPTKKAILDWNLRFSIIDGIAQGLLYLHRYSRLKIVHRDLKASNILLDGEMNPKISDFGMARIFGGNQTEESTKRVVGTLGYMAPEYALDGHFSEKSDVFSFGVLLFEIISGTKSTGFFTYNNSTRLLTNAWNMWREGRWMELMDPIYKETSEDTQQVLKCINLGLLCVQDDPNERPTMNSVVSMLSSDNITSLPQPKMPFFFSRSSTTTSSSSASVGNSNSVKQVTLSMQNSS